MNYKRWTDDELKDLKNNYFYWVEHKEDAEKFFGRNWQSIRVKANSESCFSDHHWTKVDISKLINNYTYWMEHRSEAEEVFGRTFCSIQSKATKEGCVSDSRWTKTEVSELINNYNDWSERKEEAEKFFGRSWIAIRAKANMEGCVSNRWWNEADISELINNFDYWSGRKEEAEKFFGRSWETIAAKASENGVKLDRSNSNILSNCADMINGLILSDGHVRSPNCTTAHYEQSCIYKEWLTSIKNKFDTYGIMCNVDDKKTHPIKVRNKKIYYPKPAYNIRTRAYIEFLTLRKKWYPEGKKIVPKDLELTPECVANWYLGDGSITKNKKRMFTIRLHTNGFSHKDVNFLSDLLNEKLDINSRCYVHSAENKGLVIYVSRQKDIKIFLNYIKDFWIGCYAYKFPAELLYHE